MSPLENKKTFQKIKKPLKTHFFIKIIRNVKKRFFTSMVYIAVLCCRVHKLLQRPSLKLYVGLYFKVSYLKFRILTAFTRNLPAGYKHFSHSPIQLFYSILCTTTTSRNLANPGHLFRFKATRLPSLVNNAKTAII